MWKPDKRDWGIFGAAAGIVVTTLFGNYRRDDLEWIDLVIALIFVTIMTSLYFLVVTWFRRQ